VTKSGRGADRRAGGQAGAVPRGRAPGQADAGQPVEVEGRRLVLRNLDKVLYPSTGTTKGEVISYYTQVAAAMLPHLEHRPLTRKRWPDGVDGPSFFEKNLPQGTPDWVSRVTLPVPGSTKDRETITFPLVKDLPGLVWLANLAALELHVPQWTVGPRGAVHGPNRLVIDLDPGSPAGLPECVEVALEVRRRLADDGLECFPVTSGGKGLQLYAPVSGRQDADTLREYARRLAVELERAMPRLVVSRMTKTLRPGRVLLDWSQNHAAKTTVAPYSLRGRPLPQVAAPQTWPELQAHPRQLGHAEVAQRLAADGDLLASLLTPGPRVPV
jgi:bifunctional non-homologous end joining protein LigD